MTLNFNSRYAMNMQFQPIIHHTSFSIFFGGGGEGEGGACRVCFVVAVTLASRKQDVRS